MALPPVTLDSFLSGLEGLTNEELESIIVTSPATHFSTCVEILDKSGQVIQPVPNILQLRMSQAYEVCMALGIPCRILALKPRQVGCSTFAAHIIYHHEQRRPNTRGITISDVRDNSQKLMEKLRDYRARDKFPWGHNMTSTARNVRFSNGSFHEIDSAENYKAGIGDTRTAYHASETPKWPKTGVKNDKRVMAAVLPSVPNVPESVVIAEGTPEGASGWFYETWQDALTLEQLVAMWEAGERKLVWIKIFAAWDEFEEYKRRKPNGELNPLSPNERAEIDATLTEREHQGRTTRGWSYEQIAWRRDIMRLQCADSEDTFDEYYPEDDVRCWFVAGRPRFHIGRLMAQEDLAAVNLPESGFLIKDPDSDHVAFTHTPEDSGDILIYEEPREGYRYIVGCDPAIGEDQTQTGKPDRTSIQVWRAGYYSQHREEWMEAACVARVRSPFFGDADQSAGHLERLSILYGWCLVVLEVNMGLQVLEHLKMAGCSLYKRIVPSNRPNQKAEQWGWKLKDRDQRRMLVECFASGIREDALVLNDKSLIHECKMFITDHTGKDIARAGEKDDDVLCAAMCFYTLDSATPYRKERRKRREPADRDQWRQIGRNF